jgi:hypothetical protein
MKEDWVAIEGYPNYAVSNYGRVLNIQRDTILKPRPNDEGYLRVSLSLGGVVRDQYVHRLVAAAFFTGYDPREQVFHYNGDKEENTVNNIRMKKRSRFEGGLAMRTRKQTGKRVEVVETGDVYRTARDCARYIGGDYGSVYACLRGDRRSHMGYTFRYYDEWYGENAA